jgi:hypothetical protein
MHFNYSSHCIWNNVPAGSVVRGIGHDHLDGKTVSPNPA